MKRLLIALLLACVTCAVGYGVFIKARPENKKFDCEIKWLSHKLALTPEQTERVRAVHMKYCPSMNGLGAQWKSCSDPQRAADLKRSCCESADQLVQSVCAELTPPQREKYLILLAAWKKNQASGVPPLTR